MRLSFNRSEPTKKFEEPMVLRLSAGGNRIRTIGPAEKEAAVERDPAADHRRLARPPVLNDPIQRIGPASLVGNCRETFTRAGPCAGGLFLTAARMLFVDTAAFLPRLVAHPTVE